MAVRIDTDWALVKKVSSVQCVSLAVTQPLTTAQLRELRAINRWGEPSGPEEWHGAGALWFHARDRVIGALLRRGLIEPDASGYVLTNTGREALAHHAGSAS